MKTNYLKLSVLLSAVLLALIFTSCENNDSSDPRIFENGVYISNEGTFTKSNASVSFYSYTDDTVYNDIFSDVNNRTPGDVVQSITVTEENTYIVVNNSNKIEVVNTKTLSSKSTIAGINQPRCMVVNGTKGYVTAWGDYSVKVVDLNTFEVVKSIPTGIAPDKMLIDGEHLYVTNTGTWDDANKLTVDDSTLTVIDLSTDEKLDNIVFDAYNASDLVIDKDGILWVLAKGFTNWDTYEESPAKLIKIDLDNNLQETAIEFSAFTHPGILDINGSGDELYFGGNYTAGISKISISDPSSPTQLITEMAYGFNIDVASDELFVFFPAIDYVSEGTLNRYTLDGQLIKTHQTGINPNGLAN